MEIGVDSHRHIVADAHHGSEGVGAQAQMGILAHVLEALSLLLHGIVGSAGAIDLNAFALDLAGLSLSGTFDERTDDTDTGTGCDEFEFLFSYSGGVNDHLHVLDGRAIVEGNEIDCLGAAVRTHPALHADFLAIFGVTEDINDFCSFHFSFYSFF